MALFKQIKQMKQMMGGGDNSLVGTGILGRGIVVSAAPTGASVRRGGMPADYNCQVELEIHLDDVPTYNATAQTMISEMMLPQIRPGNTMVAVWVDPNDQNHVNVDFNTAPPDVRMAADPNRLKASDILAQGSPCDAVIIQSQPLGMKSPSSGLDMYAFVLTIMVPGVPPYQIQVGNPVPPEALPLMYPGSKLPAKYMPGGQKETVVIDWDKAIAGASAS